MLKIPTHIAVLTSGGDAPGMNAAIRAVVRSAVYYGKKITGIYNGYEGLINGNFQELNSRSVKYILNQGGTFLKSARSDRFRTPEGRKQAYDNLAKTGIDALIVIGGDGSFTGAKIFSEEYDFQVIGVPGTIDNDLYGTDFTIGYDTATNTAIECIDKIRDTASSHDRLFLVEVMGRDSGFIALRSAIAAGALDVIMPENDTTYDHLVETINRAGKNKKFSNIIVVAEGNKLGNIFEISNFLKGKFPHLDIKVTILGHLQRGGSPTVYDRVLASKLGVAAVEGLLIGRNKVMAGVMHQQIIYTPFEEAITRKAYINPELIRINKILTI
ncbi:6-phosphofructokinase [Schleiferia thermophila str. Yellowstone]|jgi:6-phosphofructokinase 1|uniref:6-phosphofructokinase n=1 Tax=Schleiferia thermophila TaxID=884107 RepID=UPI0004E6686B|nr:6-phosphofructokinase [Schleiferia thermophila]KFD38918.1 6-phosphofructokinase [Schleiferia thermophila str. Yellowstone]